MAQDTRKPQTALFYTFQHGNATPLCRSPAAFLPFFLLGAAGGGALAALMLRHQRWRVVAANTCSGSTQQHVEVLILTQLIMPYQQQHKLESHARTVQKDCKLYGTLCSSIEL